MENNVLLLLCVLILVVGTDAIFTCKTTGRFPDVTDLTCKRYFRCSRTIIGTLWGTPYRCANSNFDPNTQKCSTNYPCRTPTSTKAFNLFPPQSACTSSGVFPDLDDSSCRRYFRCVKVFNFALYKLTHNCQNSLFDPVLRKCSENYDCQKNTPLLNTGTQFNSSHYSTLGTFSASSPNSSSELTETVSTEKYSIDDFLEILAISSTETTSIEEVAKTEKYNKNNEQGMRSEEETSFESNTTEFSQSTTGSQRITTTEETLTETTSINYANMADLTSVATTVQNISLFDLNDASYSTESNLDDFGCTHSGKFPDLEDKTCSQYFLCSSLRNGTILKTTYQCPNSSFDPFLKRCSKLYQCAAGKTTAPNSSINIFTSTETEIVPTIEHTTLIGLDLNYEIDTETVRIETEGSIEQFACSEIGKFPDLTDCTCQKYYHCDKLKDGTFIQTVRVCQNSTFDPILQICSKYYDCPLLQTTATSIITTMFKTTEVHMHTVENFVTESSSTLHDFRCTQAGRFPDLNDFTCKCYFLCNRLRNGTFIQTPYECPSNSIFDPLIQLCSTHTACRYEINYYTV